MARTTFGPVRMAYVRGPEGIIVSLFEQSADARARCRRVSIRRMRSSTDLVTRQVTSNKRWTHLDRTRGSWVLTGRSLSQGSGATPADPRRLMLP
jgi:hypothetical protein